MAVSKQEYQKAKTVVTTYLKQEGKKTANKAGAATKKYAGKAAAATKKGAGKAGGFLKKLLTSK